MLTSEQRDFLERVRDGRRLPLADRAQDKVRQSVRRAGMAEVLMNPRRWSITEAGRKALSESRAMTTRDKLIERVAAVIAPEAKGDDPWFRVAIAQAGPIVDALGLVEVCEALRGSPCPYPYRGSGVETVAQCIARGECGCDNAPALSTLRGEQS